MTRQGALAVPDEVRSESYAYTQLLNVPHINFA